MSASPIHHDLVAQRKDFYARLQPLHLQPLWESLATLVPREPLMPAIPALWRYRELRPYLMEAGSLISAEEAVRRVLVLENPELPGQSAITTSLYAGLQLLMPGEIAPSHRHTQTAFRLVMEGETAYTAVDGEQVRMQPGDFVITPSWTWHDHGNRKAEDGGTPVMWLDCLDIPLVRFLGAGFEANYPQATQPLRHPQGHTRARYGANMLPVRHKIENGISPLFSYPYAQTRQALNTLHAQGELDPWEGVKLRYANPANGSWPSPTMAAFMQLLPEGFVGRPWRCTDGTVYSVIEGHGRASIGEHSFDFERNDTFVVPSWNTLQLTADDDCVLFSFSDRPVHHVLGILREEFFELTSRDLT